MKVLVITGSPHKNGTSACLAEKFIYGATEAGHSVVRFDAGQKQIHPCIACETCHNTGKGCVFNDGMEEELNRHLVTADVIAFVSPIYYYMLTPQIAAVISRFYANDAGLHMTHRKVRAVMLLTMADDTEESALGALQTFKGITNYLGWEIAGTVVGLNCENVDALRETDYQEQAYNLGKSL